MCHLSSFIVVVLIGALALTGCSPADETPPATLTLAIAANMKHAADDLIAQFNIMHPRIKIRATYGSTGSFFAQIQNGAPFDLLLAADTDTPQRLAQANLADTAEVFPYATGRLALWVRNDSPVDLDQYGLSVLLDESIRRIAIANTILAPYGKAAEQALTKGRLMSRVKSRFVFGENIAQTAHFVETGGADAGLIALSLALTPTMQAAGRHWVVPAEMHDPIAQSGVILRGAGSRDAAVLFRDYLLSNQGQAILAKHGFAAPASEK